MRAFSRSTTAALAVCAVLAPPSVGLAQSGAAAIVYGDPLLLPADREIALARSAAPTAVSAEAAVLLLDGETKRWVEGVRGTNGATCYVSRTWEGSLEPHCFDPEGSATILPMHVRQSELGFAGASAEEIEREIEAGVADGRFRYPSRPAMSYMLSSGQILVDDEGRPAGSWKPHIMVYWPGLTKAELGGTGEGPLLDDSMILVDGGTDEACLIIVYPEFVDPEPTALSGAD